MPVIEGTTDLKTAIGEYDFAVDGGAVSTITLRSGVESTSNLLPVGSVIVSGYIEVDTILASAGAAAVAVGIESTTDLLGSTAYGSSPWSSTGRKSILPAATGATSVKTTEARALDITIATAALTGGKFRVVVFYK